MLQSSFLGNCNEAPSANILFSGGVQLITENVSGALCVETIALQLLRSTFLRCTAQTLLGALVTAATGKAAS